MDEAAVGDVLGSQYFSSRPLRSAMSCLYAKASEKSVAADSASVIKWSGK
jgi:hypothetical protein